MTEIEPTAGLRRAFVGEASLRGTASSDAPVIPRQRSSRARPARVHDRYLLRLLLVDASAATAAPLVACLPAVGALVHARNSIGAVAYVVLLPLVWLLSVALVRGYEQRFLAVGSEEFRRICVAGSGALAVFGTGAWAFDVPVARRLVLFGLVTTLVLTLLGRYTLRSALHREHALGRSGRRVLVAGQASALTPLVTTLRRARYHGLDIIGACTPAGDDPGHQLDRMTELRGSLDDVVDTARANRVDAVIVAACPELQGPALRRLAWQLEDNRIDLLVAPGVVEAVGPRVTVRPVCGVPLLHLGAPELSGVRRVIKGAFDRITASAALVLLSPLFLALALAVRLDSKGAALYLHIRVGRDGREFTMFKFRSMVKDADAVVAHLSNHDAGNEILFKMRADPRVTRVGRFLRKYSLDELPQLINVALGQMSLVGPRPALPKEVAQYGPDARRRLLVKPGITGLWQIKGRSDLDWEESVRLDLRYVENWSFPFDLVILAKTASAVLKGRGAY